MIMKNGNCQKKLKRRMLKPKKKEKEVVKEGTKSKDVEKVKKRDESHKRKKSKKVEATLGKKNSLLKKGQRNLSPVGRNGMKTVNRRKLGKFMKVVWVRILKVNKRREPPNEEPSNAGDNVVTKQKKAEPYEESSNAGHDVASKQKKGPLNEELSGDVTRFGRGNKGYKMPKSATLGHQLSQWFQDKEI